MSTSISVEIIHSRLRWRRRARSLSIDVGTSTCSKSAAILHQKVYNQLMNTQLECCLNKHISKWNLAHSSYRLSPVLDGRIRLGEQFQLRSGSERHEQLDWCPRNEADCESQLRCLRETRSRSMLNHLVTRKLIFFCCPSCLKNHLNKFLKQLH